MVVRVVARDDLCGLGARPPRRLLLAFLRLPAAVGRGARDAHDRFEIALERADWSYRIHAISPQTPALPAIARSRAACSASALRSRQSFSAALTSAIATCRQTCTAQNHIRTYAATPHMSARSTVSKNGAPLCHEA